jgi:hypothetical protein
MAPKKRLAGAGHFLSARFAGLRLPAASDALALSYGLAPPLTLLTYQRVEPQREQD